MPEAAAPVDEDQGAVPSSVHAGGLVFWALIAIVVLAPLHLGSVLPWSWGLLGCLAGVLLGVWAVRLALGLEKMTVDLADTWIPLSLYGVALLWIFVQSRSSLFAGWHHPLWQTAAEILGMPVTGAISINPEQTLAHLVRLLLYGTVFWLSLQACRKPVRARQVFLAVSFASIAYAAYGLIAFLTDASSVLWYEKPQYQEDLTSTFVNRNSYATYAGLGLLTTTGLILVMIAQKGARLLAQKTAAPAEGSGGATFIARGQLKIWSREGIKSLYRSTLWWERVILFGWIALVAALVFSHSRAGFASTVFALVSLVLAVGLTRSTQRRSALVLAFAFAIGIVLFLAFGGEALVTRFAETTAKHEQRPIVYDLTIAGIADAPMVGTGLGTFEEVFRFYRTELVRDYYALAHSSYLESILELGFPAAFALFGVFVWFFVLTIHGIRKRRRDTIYPCVGFAATVLVALHSLVDFSLQIPAVTVTYALIMGAACAQSWSSRHGRGGR
jgi:O-antigen ligase